MRRHGQLRTLPIAARVAAACVAALAAALLGVSCETESAWRATTPPSAREQPPQEPPEPYESRLARLRPEWSERENVEALLMSYCGECHGPDPCVNDDTCDGMNFIHDMGLLIENAKVSPGDVEGSVIVEYMVTGRMPPGDLPKAPPELIERVSAYIESLCTPDGGACEADVPPYP